MKVGLVEDDILVGIENLIFCWMVLINDEKLII